MIESVHGWRVCDCRKREMSLKRMQRNGLRPGVMTFDNFKADNPTAVRLRDMAERFMSEYPDRSFGAFGQVGAGKTHVSIAVAQAMIDKGKAVVYMPYMEMVAELRAMAFDVDGRRERMNEFKNCSLLVIDDLFKGNPKDNDLDLMFEIINNRYLNRRPIVVSSEKLLDEVIAMDEGIGTRIKEMTEGCRVQVKRDIGNNRRMK